MSYELTIEPLGQTIEVEEGQTILDAALRAGKHVLSEKPFAVDAGEARDVVAAARSAGRHVLEGFHYPFHPLYRRIVELVTDGAIGQVRHVEAPMRMPTP